MLAKVHIFAPGVLSFVSALHHIAINNCGQSIITRNIVEMKTRSGSIKSTSICEHYFHSRVCHRHW
jgi:hypothetical protein